MSYHFRISNCFHTVEDLEKSQDETLYNAYKLPDNCHANLRSTVGLGMYFLDGGSALEDNLLYCVVDDRAGLQEYVVVVRCSFEKSIKVVVEKRVDAVERALSLFNRQYGLKDECDAGSFSLTTLGLTKVSSGDE